MNDPAARLTITTPIRHGAVDVTDRLAELVAGRPHGTWLVWLEHTTAGLALGPADEGQMEDYARFAERGLAELEPFEHRHAGDDVRNGREHLLSTVVGTQLVLRVADDAVALGRWQRVLLFEFDGPKERTLHVAPLACT